MSERTFVIDHMIDHEGQIKILELQASGMLSGYRKNTGESFENVLKTRKAARGHNTYLFDGYLPALFEQVSIDKAALAEFAYRAAPEYFPHQRVFAYTGTDVKATIQNEFDTTKPLVVKVPRAAGGAGVHFMNPHDFSFYDMGPDRSRSKFNGFFAPSEDPSPPTQTYIVVQNCVTPRPITVKGQDYAPTIRTVMTLIWPETRDDETLRPDFIIEGSYYKLPSHPISSDFCSETLKSSVTKGPKAYPLSAGDEEIINRDLPDAVKKILDSLQDSSIDWHLERIFNTENGLGGILTGLNFLKDNARSDHITQERLELLLKRIPGILDRFPQLAEFPDKTKAESQGSILSLRQAFLNPTGTDKIRQTLRKKYKKALNQADKKIHDALRQHDNLTTRREVIAKIPTIADQSTARENTNPPSDSFSGREGKTLSGTQQTRLFREKLLDAGLDPDHLYIAQELHHPVRLKRLLDKWNSHIESSIPQTERDLENAINSRRKIIRSYRLSLSPENIEKSARVNNLASLDLPYPTTLRR